MKANSTENIEYCKCFIPMGILDFFSFLFQFAKKRFVFSSSVFSVELTVRWGFLSQRVTWAGFVGWADWLQEQEHFQASHDPHHPGFTVYLKVKISQQQSKVSWRGKWTLCWGFCLPRFAVNWGCPTGESERLSSCSVVGGRNRSSQVLQTFYPHHSWWHFQGFAGALWLSW